MMTTSGKAVLEVESLHHEYGGSQGTVAIDRLTFTVDRNEVLSIVGPSGCGKTTLLRCVSGLLTPTEGTIRFRGQDVTGSVPEGLAIVFQDYSRSLFPWMTVGRNVEFPLKRLGVDRPERERRVTDSLHTVGLPDVEDKHPWQLSGGMQQRVAIARALAYRPELLVMDEPFASVDAQTRADLEDLVLQIRNTLGVTVLFVTHDIDESVYIGDRVLVLSPSPCSAVADLETGLPAERDQISTKQRDDFVQLRAKVAQLIRDTLDKSRGEQGAPTDQIEAGETQISSMSPNGERPQ